MSAKLNTIIVDDEPLAQKGLSNYVNKVAFLELVAICENAFEAQEILLQRKIDVMLLDIQMPGFTGIQLLKSLDNKPITIIISAYSEHALEGFELDVIDYLIKPVAFERFLKGVQKANDFYNLQKQFNKNEEVNYLFVKSNKLLEKVLFNDIIFIEALHNYIAIHTTTKKLISYQSLKNMEALLPEHKFMKVQKSFIVSTDKIDKIEDGKINMKGVLIPMSRAIKATILMKVTKKL